MCGIAAIWQRGEVSDSLSLLRAMCEAVAHRGPDGAGYVLRDGGRIGLASARLQVMDLAHGDQPLFNEDGSVTVVCNGELYDYSELRLRLELAGHRFRTRSDSELLVHLYEEHGHAFLERLNGEFAFVLHDSRRNKIVAARDRAGVRPLYFHWADGRLLLCSEVKGLFRDPAVRRCLSVDYAYGSALGAVHDQACAFEDIQTVRPGHLLVLQGNGPPVQQPFYEWTFRPNLSIGFEEAAQHVHSAVLKSVRRRAVADVPVHCYLSGGIDSAIVCAALASTRGSVRAYHASFPGSPFGETPEARATALHCGVDLEVVECSSAAMLDNLASTVRHVELPLPNCNSVAKFLLSRAVSADGTRVCLTGEGADEMFGGYPFFRLEAKWRAALAQGRSWEQQGATERHLLATDRRSLGSVWTPVAGWREIRQPYGAPNYLHLACRAHGSVLPLISGWRRRTRHVENEFLRWMPPAAYAGLDGFNATRRMSMHRLAGGILPLLGDRVEMAHGVECRTPFLDPELLEFLSTLPQGHFIDMEKDTEKRVLRAAFRGMLPPDVLAARKHPFLGPTWRTTLDSSRGRQLLGDSLSRSSVRDCGLFSWAAVNAIRAAWQALPAETSVVRRLDPLVGLLLTTHILHDVLVKPAPIKASAEFNMVDMGDGS